MLRFLVALIAIACMASSALAIQFQAGANPDYLGGSFHKTGEQCKLYPNGLFCKCLNKYQIPNFTRLNLNFCANSASISNQNGYLTCDPIIRGSWGNSCVQANIIQDTIHASCKTKTGSTNSTDLNLLGCPSLRLENINGELQCMR